MTNVEGLMNMLNILSPKLREELADEFVTLLLERVGLNRKELNKEVKRK